MSENFCLSTGTLEIKYSNGPTLKWPGPTYCWQVDLQLCGGHQWVVTGLDIHFEFGFAYLTTNSSNTIEA